MKSLFLSMIALVSCAGMAFANGSGPPYPLLPTVTVVDSEPNSVLDQIDIIAAMTQCGNGCNLYFPAGVYLDVRIEIESFPDGFAIYGDGRGETILRGPVFTTNEWVETILIGNAAPDGVIIQDISLDGRKLDQDPLLIYPDGNQGETIPEPPTKELNTFLHHGINSRATNLDPRENGIIQRVEIYNYFTRGIGLRESPGWLVQKNVIHDIGCHVVDVPCGSDWEPLPDVGTTAPGRKLNGFGIQVLNNSDSVTVAENRVYAISKIGIEAFAGGDSNGCDGSSTAPRNTWIYNNIVIGALSGITLNGSCQPVVMGNVVTKSVATGGESFNLGNGIVCTGVGGTDLLMMNNVSTGNQRGGYEIACSGGNVTFKNNVAGGNCTGSTGSGDFNFHVSASDPPDGSNQVLKITRATNETGSNCFAGMYIQEWDEVTVEDSAIEGGVSHGLRVEYGSGIDVRRTTVTGKNSQDGVVLGNVLADTYIHPSVEVTGYVKENVFYGGRTLNDGDDVAYCPLEDDPKPAGCDDP